MDKEILFKCISNNSFSFSEFIQNIETKVNKDTTDYKNEHEKYVKINLQRMKRILKIYKPNDQITKIIKSIKNKQYWVVITEDWCGDSAQSLPYLYFITKLNTLIDIKIIYRDENPEIIDMYLTNGSRSIPKLIVFDHNFNELFQWGPRPSLGQNLVNELKGKGISKEQSLKELQIWYNKNKGEELEKEIFLKILYAIETDSTPAASIT